VCRHEGLTNDFESINESALGAIFVIYEFLLGWIPKHNHRDFDITSLDTLSTGTLLKWENRLREDIELALIFELGLYFTLLLS
jgi:hypothetical protein